MRTPIGTVNERAKAEMRFVAMAPTEHLLTLVREQDALYRGVVRVDPPSTHVTLTRERTDGQIQYRAVARAQSRDVARKGCARHADAEVAVREAFTELLRDTVEAGSTHQACPCAQAA
jgi:hypothetical protein